MSIHAVHKPYVGRMTKGKRRSIVSTIIAIVLLLIMLFPVYWMINASFFTSSQILSTNPPLTPFGGTLAGYEKALSTQGGHLVSSLIIAFGTVILTLLIAVPAGYALSRFSIPGGTAVLFALMVVQMIPNIVLANALFGIFSSMGLLDSYVALILADSTLAIPFAIILLRAFMLGIPNEVIESAHVDGAGHLRTLVKIVVPMSRNSIITSALFAFLFAWGDFLFGVTLTTGQKFVPITVGIYNFVGTQVSDWNAILASAVLTSIPAVILLFAAQRYITAGVTGGAVKE